MSAGAAGTVPRPGVCPQDNNHALERLLRLNYSWAVTMSPSRAPSFAQTGLSLPITHRAGRMSRRRPCLPCPLPSYGDPSFFMLGNAVNPRGCWVHWTGFFRTMTKAQALCSLHCVYETQISGIVKTQCQGNSAY